MIGLEFVKRFEGGTRVSDSLPTLVRVRLGLSVALSRIPQLKESHERGANLPQRRQCVSTSERRQLSVPRVTT
jgi:hypothetical protein